LPIIRFTDASTTPGVRLNVRWTRPWQAAHVIPVTGMTTFSGDDGVGRGAAGPGGVMRAVVMIGSR